MRKHKGQLVDTKNKYRLIDCVGCGFMHLYPLPSFKEIIVSYDKKFYGEIKPDYIKKEEHESDYWIYEYMERISLFNKLKKTKTKRLLDIGSSGGFILERARKEGWSVLGIEPAKKAIEYSKKKKLEIIEDYVENVDLQKFEPFDAIHLKYVFEHFIDPIQIGKKIKKSLKKGGILCVEVPNERNRLQMVLQKKLHKNNWWFAPPIHINYFTNVSLKNFFKKIGLKIIYEQATFPIEFFALSGDDYIGNDTIGRKTHIKRMEFERSLAIYDPKLRQELYESYAKLGIGRSLVYYAIKQ